MTHTFYVIQRLKFNNPAMNWLTLNQATVDFQRNAVSLHCGLVTVTFNHIARVLLTLTTDDFCVILPRTEQVINVWTSNDRLEGCLMLIEALAYGVRNKFFVARSISKTTN